MPFSNLSYSSCVPNTTLAHTLIRLELQYGVGTSYYFDSANQHTLYRYRFNITNVNKKWDLKWIWIVRVRLCCMYIMRIPATYSYYTGRIREKENVGITNDYYSSFLSSPISQRQIWITQRRMMSNNIIIYHIHTSRYLYIYISTSIIIITIIMTIKMHSFGFVEPAKHITSIIISIRLQRNYDYLWIDKTPLF